jgi:hypothetical protein
MDTQAMTKPGQATPKQLEIASAKSPVSRELNDRLSSGVPESALPKTL